MLQFWMMRLYSARETIGLCAAMVLGLLMASTGFFGWPSQETILIAIAAVCLVSFAVDAEPTIHSLAQLAFVMALMILLSWTK